jgi:hypothetical protein
MNFARFRNDMVVRNDVALGADHEAGSKGLSHLRLNRPRATAAERTEEVAEGQRIRRRLVVDKLPGRDRDHGRYFLTDDSSEVAGYLLGCDRPCGACREHQSSGNKGGAQSFVQTPKHDWFLLFQ